MLVLPLNIMDVFLFSKIGQDASIKWKRPHLQVFPCEEVPTVTRYLE